MSALDMLFDGAFASAAATLISNPFDVMRTRFQLQGELCKTGQYHVVYRNLAQGMYRVAREEGIGALQKGLAPAILWQITQNGIRIGLYPVVKAEIGRLAGGDSFGVSVLSGALCGVAGSVVASPFMMVKTRLQSQRNTMVSLHGRALNTASTGTQFHYRGVWDALTSIYRENGLRGLWHGSVVAAQRTMMGSATQLATYDKAKEYGCHYLNLKPSDVRVHVFAATVASFFIVLFMNPLDVVMTRSYNHPIGEKQVYSSNLAVATWKIYRVEGIRGLYKGSLALFSRSAPHTIATFVVLEWVRKFREKHTNRSYTSGSTMKKSIGFGRGVVQDEPAVAAATKVITTVPVDSAYPAVAIPAVAK